MSENIKKVNLQKTDNKVVSGQNKSLDIGSVKKVSDNSNWEMMSFIDDVAGFFGKGPYSIENGYELLRRNKIDYSKDDIKSVEKCGADGENIKVIMKNGEEFLFAGDGDDYTLEKIELSNGIVIHMNISDNMKKIAKEEGPINDDVDIKGYANIEVNGESVPVYWVDDISSSFEVFKKHVQNVKDAFDKIPNNVKDKILEGYDFKGFYVGGYYSQHENPGYFNGFAHDNEYVYIETCGANYETIIHEIGHILDFSIGNGTSYYSSRDYRAEKYYRKYKDSMKELIPDNSGYHRTGPINDKEFFACLFEMYLERPDEVSQLFPELYDYMDNIVKSV